MPISLLQTDDCSFPAVEQADDEIGGLLAVGGDLSVDRLRSAYRSGIFPWFSEGDPLLWWSPAERCIILPQQFHCSRSLTKKIRNGHYTLTSNREFKQVVSACARRGSVTRNQDSTWIVPAMQHAYSELHQSGDAHSLELWHEDKLVAGLYGVQVGALFCGESMYSDTRDGSKVLLFGLLKALADAHFSALDCQVSSHHLLSLGATTEPREHFINRLEAARDRPLAWPLGDSAVRLTA